MKTNLKLINNHKQRAAGLIVVLSLIVLVSIIVLAFFNRALLESLMARSSEGHIRAGYIADAAILTIIGDLRREMAAGSTIYGNSDFPIFDPKKVNNKFPTVIPLRNGVPALPASPPAQFPETWIRRSVESSAHSAVPPVYGGFRHRAASPVNSSLSSAKNGGPVSNRRWNTHYLLPRLNPNSWDPTPNNHFQAPDWMYVTRSGVGRKLNGNEILPADVNTLRDSSVGNPDFIVGRIAYAIYDVGSLPDVNVLGYVRASDSNYASVPSAEVARKGSPGLGNLGAIEGVINADALVRWRNSKSARTGSFATVAFPSSTTHDYVKYLFNPSLNNAHMSLLKGDQAFINRKDLINYAKNNPNILEPKALRHLTTFSRDIDAPNWSPSQPRDLAGNSITTQNNVDYEAQANATDTQALAGLSAFSGYGWPATHVFPLPNRNVPLVTIPNNTTQIRDWDGRLINVKAGQPVLSRRFPLSRIDLFRQYYEARQAGQNTADLERSIRYSFGLVPDPLAPAEYGRWLYIYRTLINADTLRILTLDEVVRSNRRVGPLPTNLNAPASSEPFNEPRLPNFFEILQAGILHGDIGYGNSVLACNEFRYFEIFSLGANIIDQYDEDNHPTFLRTHFPSFPRNALQNNFVGKENLPHLSEMILTGYRPTNFPERRMIMPTLEFEIWNLHQNAGQWSGNPFQVRISAEIGAVEISARVAGTPYKSAPIEHLRQEDFSLNNQYKITFEYPTAGSFADPVLLHENIPGIKNDSRKAGMDYGPPGPENLFGFHLPPVQAPFDVSPLDKTFIPLSPGDPLANNFFTISVKGVTDNRHPLYEMQYLDTRSNPASWKTYNVLRHNRGGFGASHNLFGAGNNNFWPGSETPRYTDFLRAPHTSSGQRTASWFPLDPRRTFFQLMGDNASHPTPNASLKPSRNKNPKESRQYFISVTRDIFATGGVRIPSQDPNAHFPDDLVDNTGTTQPPSWFMQGYDGIRRPTDADLSNDILPTVNSTSNWFLANLAKNSAVSRFVASDLGPGRLRDRPVHLNRPFRSVAEMGYVFAEQPWKTLDFRSHLSSHSGLLDMFTLYEHDSTEPPIVAGRININTVTPQALEAIIAAGGRNPLVPAETFSAADAKSIAERVVKIIREEGPLRSRADFVETFARGLGNTIDSLFPARKTEREAVVRSFIDSAQTRTWNLMIDIIAQSGRLTSNAANLGDFFIEGEKRLWVSLAIDRFTGRVIDINIENVHE